MTSTVMTIWADSMAFKPNRPADWNYEQALVLKAVEGVWKRTGEGKYFRYIQKQIDLYIDEEGNIRTYDLADYNIDNVTGGRVLLMLYNETGKEKYKKAAFLLRKQLETHPRTSVGGFWHKKRYPNQMWLDGLYMGEPFYAEFSRQFNQPDNFDDIAKQLILMERYGRDPKTGLLYHGWDESKEQKWADPKTGRSPNVWGRAMGWYAMALVDVLDYFPATHPKRDSIVAILKRLAPVIVKYQDQKSGVWYQVVDKATEKGNYLEASGSGMLTYALAKGVRKGYLDASYLKAAKQAYQGILKTFIKIDEKGLVQLNGICSVAGLGGNPYRDGSYAYYLSEKVVANDPKGIGPFILASTELEIAAENSKGKGKKVGLDYYFNSEYKKGADGQSNRFHYTWEDPANSGFSLWGSVFENLGATIQPLTQAPTSAKLKDINVYIIVDPDTPKESEKPNYIGSADIKNITDWVNAGGVLVLMANDSGNVEMTHLNQLAEKFGIHFNRDSYNRVQGAQFEMGKVVVSANHPVFKEPKQLYIKEFSSLQLTAPAKSLLTHKGVHVMASSKVGKGTVFAVGDPWLYNEYTDGKKIPEVYKNFEAGKELATWLLEQAAKNDPIR